MWSIKEPQGVDLGYLHPEISIPDLVSPAGEPAVAQDAVVQAEALVGEAAVAPELALAVVQAAVLEPVVAVAQARQVRALPEEILGCLLVPPEGQARRTMTLIVMSVTQRDAQQNPRAEKSAAAHARVATDEHCARLCA